MFPDMDMLSVYMFFDEIQLINDWEYFVMRLYKHCSRNIYISGSNATMLGSELKSVSRGIKVSKDDLYCWANYACNVFMFIRISNYSRSLQKVESSQPKYYCIDNGLRDAVLLPQSDDDGKKLENTVFLQLYRQRTPMDRIFYYQGKGKCDFVVQRGIDIYMLVQVTWNMDDEDTRKREISGIKEAADATGCRNMFIITADSQEEIMLDNGMTIHVVPAWRWLLGLS